MPENTKKEREFTLQELAGNSGAEGSPAFVAYDGKVYDVSDSGLWGGGQHMGRHQAGKDLTLEFADAPHDVEVFERYPQVGILMEKPPAPEKHIASADTREFLQRLLHAVPLLRRHPHPMLVHFPIVFLISAAAFTILYLLTGNASFEVTGFHCLAGGLLFIPPVIATGVFTWWLNYESRLLTPVLIKLILSPLLLVLAAGLFAWRLLNPSILATLSDWPSLVYLALLGVLALLTSIVGWYGAKLTFPLPGD